MHIPVHSPWLDYIGVVQTGLIILTVAGCFPDRPCTQNIQISTVIGKNEVCVFYFTEKTKWTF